jgi:hypothetical protein
MSLKKAVKPRRIHGFPENFLRHVQIKKPDTQKPGEVDAVAL